MKTLFFGILFLTSIFTSIAQEVTQTIRGVVRDRDSRETLAGANVIITGGDNLTGTSTDATGKFIFENIPAGRISIKISYIGYEEKFIPNIIVGGGKQVVLDIELSESLVKLDEAVVSAQKDKAEVLNEMALLSSRTFSVEETKRYAGSFNDPARMVSSYAGVTNQGFGNNDIIVRGNSSKGILWRLEGIEIPNPNHFAGEGTTGGPINALNSSMLSNSDFFTGAFAPEYGNAASGVFDMKLRTGNNKKHERSLGIGIGGIDATLEGPLSAGNNSSYLVNYRYSSLAILDNLGVVDFRGVPKYQDGAYKIFLPTKNFGTFTLFGLAGKSSIYQQNVNQADEKVTWDVDFRSHLGVSAITHLIPLKNNAFFRNTISVSTSGSGENFRELIDENLTPRYKGYLNKFTYNGSSIYNQKINNRHTFKAGAFYTLNSFDFTSEYYNKELKKFILLIDEEANAGLMRGFASWKYRINEDLTLVSGLHYTHFLLNNANSVEPRAGLKWQLTEKQSLNAGFGIHSKLEPLTVYHALVYFPEGNYFQPNKNLSLSKATHYVLGYENLLTKNLLVKAELYYQNLFDVPVEDDSNSAFSVINTSGWFSDITLVNEGKGSNYGLELTVERYFNDGYFFLGTASLYQSEYAALDGKWRNTQFNGNYTVNFLFGKEFVIGDKSRNRTLGLSGKGNYNGGQWYTPIDLEKSIAKGQAVQNRDEAFSKRAEPLFITNMVVYYRKERPKTTHEIRFDVQNITNHSARLYEYYDAYSKEIKFGNQLPLLPYIGYTIDF
jgi:hypothetical protein